MLKFCSDIPFVRIRDLTYCDRCGTKVEENAHFCHKCGTPVVMHLPPPPPATLATSFRKDPLILLAVVLISVLVVAVIAVAVFAGPIFSIDFNQTYSDNHNINRVSLKFSFTMVQDSTILMDSTNTAGFGAVNLAQRNLEQHKQEADYRSTFWQSIQS